jgi:hypothetical protein
MKRARYRGDVSDQFRVGAVIGRTDSGAFVRCVGVEYDPVTDRTIVTGEHMAPFAPDGMRLRYHGDDTGGGRTPPPRPPVDDPIEAQ